jgi:hypothetical protein
MTICERVQVFEKTLGIQVLAEYSSLKWVCVYRCRFHFICSGNLATTSSQEFIKW